MSEAKGPIYDDYEDVFRRHYEQNYDRENVPFGRVAIAYSHGFNMAVDEQEEHRDWVECEEEVRQAWEEEEAGPWQNFRQAVRKGWETAKEALGG